LDEVGVLDKETPVISIIHAQLTGKLKFNACKKAWLSNLLFTFRTCGLSFPHKHTNAVAMAHIKTALMF